MRKGVIHDNRKIIADLLLDFYCPICPTSM